GTRLTKSLFQSQAATSEAFRITGFNPRVSLRTAHLQRISIRDFLVISGSSSTPGVASAERITARGRIAARGRRIAATARRIVRRIRPAAPAIFLLLFLLAALATTTLFFLAPTTLILQICCRDRRLKRHCRSLRRSRRPRNLAPKHGTERGSRNKPLHRMNRRRLKRTRRNGSV